jgi:hypothetical protein
MSNVSLLPVSSGIIFKDFGILIPRQAPPLTLPAMRANGEGEAAAEIYFFFNQLLN